VNFEVQVKAEGKQSYPEYSITVLCSRHPGICWSTA